MSRDHADTVREALGLLSSMVASRESHTLTSVERSREAHASLDALVAERDEVLRSLASMEASRVDVIQQERMETAHFVARAEAAEAERDRLADNNKHTHANLNFCIEQRMGLEARVTELEAALAKCPPDCLANLDAIPAA